MQIKTFDTLPKQAAEIRNDVFIKEQGFENEFDTTDSTATHFVAFNDDGSAIATCRVFWDKKINSYVLGRLAVIKSQRGKVIGAAIVEEALDYVKNMGKKELMLHTQCRITGFYEKLGFTQFGDIEYEEDCPHIWMKKRI